jgi:CO/xanthine dehydrogenase FAD-binding subunit
MRKHLKYLRPATAAEAVDMKASYGDRSRFWAGGTDLLLQWRRNEVDFDYCVDLSFIPELRRLECAGGDLRIGATTSLARLERAGDVHDLAAYLASVARVMCTPQTRTLATLGGNLCNASPAADLAPPLIVLDAQARILGPAGERSVLLSEFFAGVNRTVLDDHELLTEVRVPLKPVRQGGFARVGRTAVDVALVVAAASVSANGNGTITSARISIGSAAPTPLRIQAAEEMLAGADLRALDGLLDQAARRAAEDTRPITDLRTTASYRSEVSRVLVRRSLEMAIAKLDPAGGRS